MTLFSHQRALYRLAIVLVIGLAVARILATYHVFSQTADEPSDIACGMQILQDRVYTMDVKHPPLGRIVLALGLYFEGARLEGPLRDYGTEPGNKILYFNNNYWHNLALARLGTLPFFLLACVVAWCWSNHLWGKRTALLALLLLTLLPPVLAHAGMATNDMAGAATSFLALYCLTLWIEKPAWGAAARLGAAAGLALASKLSAFLFLPGGAAVLILLCLAVGADSLRQCPGRKIAGHLALCLAAAYFVLWAGYLFTAAPLEASRPHAVVDRALGSHPILHDAVCAILETRFPAGKVAAGLAGLGGQNKAGQVSFFLGEWRRHGWWYFFPLIFLLKTPLPFLLLAGLGAVFLARSFAARRDWRSIAPVVLAVAVLALAMTSHINVGLRHILVIYPLLALVAGFSASKLWDAVRRPMIARGLAVAACAWLAVCSALAHPDYLAYFNCLAGGRPERIEVDSDLDWGQDLARLSNWLRARGVQEVALSYFGTADLTRAQLPTFHELVPYQKTTGWVAISARNRVTPSLFISIPSPPGVAPFYTVPGDFDVLKPGNGPFDWLLGYQPVGKIGYSIFVYHIDAE
jgi:4-amino-4-deoxy-L-arabinose transferase-like glycosyltransferase